MSDILFYGDPHGDFEPLLTEVGTAPPSAVILLGDMEAPKPLDTILRPIFEQGIPVHWIAGNHDTDSHTVHDNLFHSGLAPINLHGKVVNVHGIRIAGLGGVFREKVWNPNNTDMPPPYMSRQAILANLPKHHRWRDGLPLRHRSSIFPEDYQDLLGQRADIVVTHEAPECQEHGFKAIGRLAGCLYAHRIVHGHHHVDYDSTLIGGISVRGVGRRRFYRLDIEAFKSEHGLV